MASPTQVIFSREGKEVIDNIRGLLSSSGANATGKTAASLELLATDERLLITGGKAFGLNRREDSFVEGGRGAGALPPFMAIAEWAIARGIVSDVTTGVKTINAIRWKIARKGTKLNMANVTRDIYTSIITDEKVDEIIDQATGVFAQNVLSDIVKEFRV